MARRIFCPVCKENVAVTKNGCLMQHGRSREVKGSGKLEGDVCAGTGQKVLEPEARL